MKFLHILTILSFFFTVQIKAQKTKQPPLRPFPNKTNLNSVVGCSVFNNSQNYTCRSSFSIIAPIDDNSGYTEPLGANWDCYGSRPNQLWLLFTVTTSGNLVFTINGSDNISNSYDIDGIIWGPIADGNFSNACSVTTNQPISCDWDAGAADLVVNNAQVGQVYVMLVTNYSNENNTISINQPTGGSVNYCMANIPAGTTTNNSFIHTQTGLISCYSFSGNSQDEINNNHGNNSNVSLTADRFGNPNSAYQFNGSTSSYVNIPNTRPFINNSYTYTGWVKATNLPSSGGTAWILGIGQNGVGDQSLYIYNNGGVVSFTSHAYADPTYCLYGLFSSSGGVTVNQNQWYHIAVTMGATAYRMYVNGRVVATSASSCVSMIYGNPTAYIGSRLGYLSPFNGIIDDVRIYNRELSPDEIKNILYTKGCRSICPESISLTTQSNGIFPLREEANQIIATNIISSLSKIRYDGTTSVLLQPGFKVEQGAVFEAFNNGCGGDR